jgi:hypothetical protein
MGGDNGLLTMLIDGNRAHFAAKENAALGQAICQREDEFIPHNAAILFAVLVGDARQELAIVPPQLHAACKACKAVTAVPQSKSKCEARRSESSTPADWTARNSDKFLLSSTSQQQGQSILAVLQWVAKLTITDLTNIRLARNHADGWFFPVLLTAMGFPVLLHAFILLADCVV